MRTVVVVLSCLMVIGTTTGASAEPMFSPSVNYSAGLQPYSIFSSDFDGDGDYDLAVSNQTSDNVSILKNNGDGTFQAATNFIAGDWPYSVIGADLDDDGDCDLAVANYNSNNVSVLMNDGNGIFQAAVNYSAGDRPSSVFSADVDGDGDFDLAVTNTSNVSILLNYGNGTFQTAVNYNAGDRPSSVFFADLDGDGDSDAAVTNQNSDNVSILRNNSNGTFQAAVNYDVGVLPHALFSADLDGDGDYDVAVANAVSNNVSILKNNGDGTFQVAVNYDAGDGAWSIFCADLDGDGDSDLTVPSSGYDSLSILANNGDGTFQTAVSCGAQDYPVSIFVADFDSDGDKDIAAANYYSNSVSILMNLNIVEPLYAKIQGQAQVVCGDVVSPLEGVQVDLYLQDTGDLIAGAMTSSDGSYEITEIESGLYAISIVTPLGCAAITDEIPLNIEYGQTIVADFMFACLESVGEPRSSGFWKHQVGIATGGRGNAQIDAEALCGYLDLIESHFNSNAINHVVVYQPPSSGLSEDKLLEIKGLLNLRGQQEMIARARQHLMTSLLNVAAGYLTLGASASVDGATISQAITYCDNLIDDPVGNYEIAKDIAEAINKGQLVGAGVIPLDVVNIAYRIPGASSQGYILQQNEPNPFNPATNISYAIPGDGHVSLVIYSLGGRVVRTLVGDYQSKGNYAVIWNGTNDAGRRVASGTYLYKLKSGQFEDLRKMTLVK